MNNRKKTAKHLEEIEAEVAEFSALVKSKKWSKHISEELTFSMDNLEEHLRAARDDYERAVSEDVNSNGVRPVAEA